MQFQGSEGAGTDLHGLRSHPGVDRREALPMSARRLARRIRAFHRLMEYRRELSRLQAPESGEDTVPEDYDLNALLDQRYKQLMRAIQQQARALARQRLTAIGHVVAIDPKVKNGASARIQRRDLAC